MTARQSLCWAHGERRQPDQRSSDGDLAATSMIDIAASDRAEMWQVRSSMPFPARPEPASISPQVPRKSPLRFLKSALEYYPARLERSQLDALIASFKSMSCHAR
jgi:hypothetical protein